MKKSLIRRMRDELERLSNMLQSESERWDHGNINRYQFRKTAKGAGKLVEEYDRKGAR